ncbi:hypothetical protein [Chromobacterium violaceum]|uniref:hypothetical protein n=1 Tax=Chromobacterium violaceum TaxID=536 RepID=UPI0012D2E288|nr:hypothetical protein [Chromobacterium violaceum]
MAWKNGTLSHHVSGVLRMGDSFEIVLEALKQIGPVAESRELLEKVVQLGIDKAQAIEAIGCAIEAEVLACNSETGKLMEGSTYEKQFQKAIYIQVIGLHLLAQSNDRLLKRYHEEVIEFRKMGGDVRPTTLGFSKSFVLILQNGDLIQPDHPKARSLSNQITADKL